MNETEILGLLTEMTAEMGKFPTLKDVQYRNNRLRMAILGDGRGMGYFATKLGHAGRQRWTKEKVIEETQKVIDQLGHFPGKNELYAMGLNNLSQAIYKYFGGLEVMREQFDPQLSEVRYEQLPSTEPTTAGEVNKLDDILLGSLLGDGYLRKPKNPRCNSQFAIKQKEDRLEYVEWLQVIFGGSIMQGVRHAPIKLPCGKVINDPEQLKDRELLYYRALYAPSSSFYTELRKKWYPEGKKIVPRDIKLTPQVLAHWHIQDGHNHQKRTCISIYTNGFTEDDVLFLIGRLHDDLGIDAHLAEDKTRPIIYVGKDSYFKFIGLVKPYVTWKCFEYKVDTSKVKAKRANFGRYKLTLEDARKIRRLYATDQYTQQRLAEMFKVSQVMIGRIINNKAHVDHAVGFGGECEVKVCYNV